MRKWETWNRGNTKRLAHSWGNPKDLTLNSTSKIHRHSRLLQEAFLLIEGESILDVACGLGHLFALTKGYFRYLGIDTSQPMIDQALAFFPQDQDKFQLGDAYNLTMLPNSDTVIAIGLILHLPKSEPVITQLWNRTKICTIFTAWITETLLLRKVPPSPRSIKQRIQRNHFILRSETLESLDNIFNTLPGLNKVESFPFFNPYPGESNYFFKLWKEKQYD